MVPAPVLSPHSSRRLLTLGSLAVQHVPRLFSSSYNDRYLAAQHATSLAKRTGPEIHGTELVVFSVLIPVLVLLSGVFAGLTLGYMSLDETQLNVLALSGTPQQRIYANKIKPIRKNGHLLLVTLLIANMVVNETLPIISDPVLGGGPQSVAVSTVLVVIFSEIIPQSLCTRYGLYIGAKMAGCTKVLIYALGIVSWPVAKLLEFTLGKHHGIIYRRAELKELIAMHSSMSAHGGDLKKDTVTIIGATLDLQEKVVEQAMTPIADVFMLSIDARLDYALLTRICKTGHSRVPVYEEVVVAGGGKARKIVGILLVKNCVLLDPKDAVPIRKIPLNKVPYVPANEPLLGIMDRFQEGRSHMAIVSRFSVAKAASIKKTVKTGLTQRIKSRVGMGDSSDEDEDDKGKKETKHDDGWADGDATIRGDGVMEKDFAAEGNGHAHTNGRPGRGRSKRRTTGRQTDLEMGIIDKEEETAKPRSSFVQLPKAGPALEQSMPADAVLGKEGAEEFLVSLDPAVSPLGIITLEDVLEELIGEEIYDEFDPQGAHAELANYEPPAPPPAMIKHKSSAPELAVTPPGDASATGARPTTAGGKPTASKSLATTPVLRPIAIKGFSFLRSRSAPPTPRDVADPPAPAAVPVPPSLLMTPAAPEAPAVVVEDSAVPPPGDAAPVKVKSIPVGGLSTPRSASPAPSLEAILLERKRRGAAAVPGAVSATSLAPPRAPGAPKGRFKSSPLGGEWNGVVVAEQVKEDLARGEDAEKEGAGMEGKEEGRIPDVKDKEGPDIPEEQ
ncbi:hypothetical protein PLICRDRAFT_38844 [Plicaturopsis crispa FD-325 SS-3]|nr:hypothetical protein PLICRDRAFT_38844 [Plicaturopsis crispa FD-325 SS-3]